MKKIKWLEVDTKEKGLNQQIKYLEEKIKEVSGISLPCKYSDLRPSKKEIVIMGGSEFLEKFINALPDHMKNK